MGSLPDAPGGVIASPSCAHELGEDRDAAESLLAQAEELLAVRVADHVEARGQLRSARVQRRIDPVAQLIPHERVRDRRRADHCDGDRGGGRQCQASAKAHASRSA